MTGKLLHSKKPQDIISFIHSCCGGYMLFHMGNQEFAALTAFGTSLHRYSAIEKIQFFSVKAEVVPSNTRPIHTEQTSHLHRALPSQRFPKRVLQLDHTDYKS